MLSVFRLNFRLLALILVAMLPGRIAAQSSTAVLTGRVLDPAGAPIAGARVNVSLLGRESGSPLVTDALGEFSAAVQNGTYKVRVAADGFQDNVQELAINGDGSQKLDIVLRVAAPHDTVTIVGTDYQVTSTSVATKTLTPLRNLPQSIGIVTQEQIRDQQMMSIGDVVRYVPGVTAHQGENNRDQIVIRGNNSSADFFLNGVRDDVQYYRDLYNVERVEVLKGPNAMIFGRGGGGGVINRVTKEAGFAPLREITIQGGAYGNKRFTGDFEQALGSKLAVRLNGMYENSGSFRDFVGLERYGINPTLTLAPGLHTRVTIAYENFQDHRTADRGIPSFQGKPVDIDISTYFGNPALSRVRALVNIGTVAVEHETGGLLIRNRTQFGSYDRGYQNFVPGTVNASKTLVSLSAYNNATARLNVFNQTDLTYSLSTGRVRHMLLGGVELGRQLTDNFRNTGFFNNAATSIQAPYSNPTISTPVTFRQSATDANNHLVTDIVGVYVQDQIEISRRIQVVTGLRFDNFDLQFHNNRTADDLRRIDNLVSPRVGLIFKPAERLSIYGNYSVSYLPSSGDQFSSLTNITQQVKPEKFNNYEIGAKWDLLRALSFTTAVYRLDRINTRATDPNDPTRIVQTGSQRANGYEAALTGRITHDWEIAGGYAYQDAFITSATTAARAGAQMAQAPHHTFSVWNNYRVASRLKAGLGIIHRSNMFAAIDNGVALPGYTRADVGVFYTLSEKFRLQANVENLFDRRYYVNADNNTNISPGSPRAVRMALTARF